MAVLTSFDLKGNKQSFASWISMLSPVDTPFTSMIGKEGITQSQYSWQTDRLAPADNSAYDEGSQFEMQARAATQEITNFTSTLRKVVQVSASAEAVSTHGRSSELAYQMGKAGKEIKRDLEWMNLSNISGNIGSGTIASQFSGFEGLVADLNAPDPDTGAIVHKAVEVAAGMNSFDSKILFDLTYNLYLAGAKVTKIMYHPKHASAFSMLVSNNFQEVLTYRMFDGLDDKFNTQVKQIRDPLGQTFTLIPNRFMPADKIYFFNEMDWTQMILRAPKITQLAKKGSSDTKMIEMEVGLRHKHPYASGILTLTEVAVTNTLTLPSPDFTAGVNERKEFENVTTVDGGTQTGDEVFWYSSNTNIVRWEKGAQITDGSGKTTNTLIVGNKVGVATIWTVCKGVKSADFVINTRAPITEFSVDDKDPSVGGTVTLSALVKKVNGDPVDAGVVVTWHLEPAGHMTLESATSVPGADGIATVMATVEVQDATTLAQCSVGRFYSDPIYLNYVPSVNSIDLDITPNTMVLGGSREVTALVLDHEENPLQGVELHFRNSNPECGALNSEVGTTDDQGRVSLTLTGIKKGGGYIVTTVDGVSSNFSTYFVGIGAIMDFQISPNPTDTSTETDFTVVVIAEDGSALSGIPVTFVTDPVVSPEIPGGTTDNRGVYETKLTPAALGDYRVAAYVAPFGLNKVVDLVIE